MGHECPRDECRWQNARPDLDRRLERVEAELKTVSACLAKIKLELAEGRGKAAAKAAIFHFALTVLAGAMVYFLTAGRAP